MTYIYYSLAILKDAWTVHVLLDTIKESFDFARGKQVSDKKAMAKYIIFLAAFVFEDIGQVLIQEMYQYLQGESAGFQKIQY